MNGWCISFIGKTNEILIGWYENNLINGNFMALNADNMSVIEGGWYNKNKRMGPMKAHQTL